MTSFVNDSSKAIDLLFLQLIYAKNTKIHCFVGQELFSDSYLPYKQRTLQYRCRVGIVCQTQNTMSAFIHYVFLQKMAWPSIWLNH